MRKIFFGILLFSIFQTCTMAQQPDVNSRTYRLMLKTLLSHSVSEISVEKAAEQQGEAFFLDTRSEEEFTVSRIAGATFADYDTFSLEAVENIPKDQAIIVYCSVGYRSEKISEQLIAAGYENVHNLYGGIFEWKNQGEEVVNENGEETERVHAYNRTWGLWLKKGEKVY